MEKWQDTVDLIAKIVNVPAGLIMQVSKEEIKVLVASQTEGNPYKPNEKADLGTGLYCETVMSTCTQLYIKNALEDDDWKNNPDIKLNMIFYYGLPLVWPDGSVFGTFCVLDDKKRSFSKLYQDLFGQFKDMIEADFQLMDQAVKLKDHQDHLEDVIEKRTNKLKQEITVRLKAEERLRQEIAARQQLLEVMEQKSNETDEANIALRVLLNTQKDVAEEVQQNVLTQLQKAVLPYISLLRESTRDGKEKEYLDIISEHVQAVGSSFIKKLSNPDLAFTKKEILVADMVRQGRKTKKIAELLNIQPASVETYRNRIRKKLNIKNKDITLYRYLNSTVASG